MNSEIKNYKSKLDENKLIRSNSSTVKLCGYKITSTDYMIKGMEDKIYKSNPEIWAILTRGTCIVTVEKNNSVVKTVLLNGLHKFGDLDTSFGSVGSVGSVGYSPSGFAFKEKETPEIEEEWYTRKENGECFHAKAFEIVENVENVENVNKSNNTFWIIGSKNVHCVVTCPQDAKLWTKDRFGYCKEMVEIFFNQTTAEMRQKLAKVLIENDCTACAESCNLNHQHLVKYSSNSLRFFALTRLVTSPGGPSVLTAMPVQDMHNLLVETGVPVVETLFRVPVSDKTAREKARNAVFTEPNSEGAVVYCTDKHGNVLKIYKWKNADYIIRRAFREKIRGKHGVASLKKRFDNLHIETTESHKKMLKEYELFYKWLIYREAKDSFDWSRLADHWISTENEFFTSDYLNKEFKVISIGNHLSFNWDEIEKCVSESNKYIVATVAPCPGIGKTTIAKSLEQILPNSVRVNQDECGGRRQPFIKRLKELCASDVKFVIVDKTNNTVAQRKDYFGLGRSVIFLNFYTPEDLSKLEKVVISRIQNRGNCHLNLFYNSNTHVIINSFLNRYEPLDHSVERIDINPFDTSLEQLKVVKQLFDYNFVKLLYTPL